MIWSVGSSHTAKVERLERGEVARRQHLCMLAPSLTVTMYVEGTSHIVQSTHAAWSLDSSEKESQQSSVPPRGGCHSLIETMPDYPRFLCHLSFHP